MFKRAKKFRQVVIHAGIDKAGSSSIQDALDRARTLLLDDGHVAYAPGVWHAELASYFSENPVECQLNKGQGLGDLEVIQDRDKKRVNEIVRWANVAPSCESLVFSFEGFVNLNADELRELKKFASQFANRIRVLVYVRPPLSYTLSAMSQRVRFGQIGFVDGYPPLPEYIERFGRLERVFGKRNIVVRKFERSCLYDGDVVSDLLHYLHVPDQVIGECKLPHRTNESMSLMGLIFGNLLIQELGQKGLSKYIPSHVFSRKFGVGLMGVSGQKMGLSAQQAREVVAISAPHVKYIHEKYDLSLEEDKAKYVLEESPEEDPMMMGLLSSLARLCVLQFEAELLVKDAEGEIVCVDESIDVDSGIPFALPVTLKNNARGDWVSVDDYPLKVSYHILDAQGTMIWFEGARTEMPTSSIAAGASVNIDLLIDVPEEPGSYILQIVPVQEGYSWFDDKGFTPRYVKMSVRGSQKDS